MPAETCWILSDGNAGNENPCLGLAEAVGLATTVKRVRPRAPWSHLPPLLWLAPFSAPGPGSDPLEPPWPDLLIAAGRQSVALSIAIKRASDGRCFTVQLLDPRVDPANFDLVVAPKHDRLEGANVIATRGALNRITPERLAAAAREFEVTVAALPSPRVAVLIGGASKRHRMTAADAAAIGERLAAFAGASGAGLMVTTSRRTGADNTAVLRAKLGDVATAFWDGVGANPYFGYLALAEAIVVTSDSVAMASEACATGKPVFVIELPGGSAKLERFHHALAEAGCTRPFTDAVAAGGLQTWRYTPLGETASVAGEVRRRIGIE